MGTRRRARECALQLLYMWDHHRKLGGFDPSLFWEEKEEEAATRDFADMLVAGVVENIEEIDRIIGQASLNWRIERMAMVDRNILRLATYELMAVRETPVKVVLNEAIELGKKYGTEESSAFVNGVLDKVASLIRGGEPQQEA